MCWLFLGEREMEYWGIFFEGSVGSVCTRWGWFWRGICVWRKGVIWRGSWGWWVWWYYGLWELVNGCVWGCCNCCWSVIKMSILWDKCVFTKLLSSSFSAWEPKRVQRQRFASSIALIGLSVRTVLVSPNMGCRVLRVAGHSSTQCSRVWLSWRHFGHLGSVVGSIRCRYAASCMLYYNLSLANMTASLLLVSVFSSLAVEFLAYTAAVLAWEGGLSFRVRLVTALAAFRLVGLASSPSFVASLENLSASSFPGMSMWPGTRWKSMWRSMASSRRQHQGFHCPERRPETESRCRSLPCRALRRCSFAATWLRSPWPLSLLHRKMWGSFLWFSSGQSWPDSPGRLGSQPSQTRQSGYLERLTRLCRSSTWPHSHGWLGWRRSWHCQFYCLQPVWSSRSTSSGWRSTGAQQVSGYRGLVLLGERPLTSCCSRATCRGRACVSDRLRERGLSGGSEDIWALLPGGGYQLPGDCLIAGQARFDAEAFHMVLRSLQAVHLQGRRSPRWCAELPGRCCAWGASSIPSQCCEGTLGRCSVSRLS